MRMKSIISFLKKHHLLWMSPVGIFAALFIGYFVYRYFDATPTSYTFGVLAFAGISLLLYFNWGYHETDPGAFGNYTGVVIAYTLISAIICFFGFMSISALVGCASVVICVLMGVYLTVPIIKFFQENGWL